ncbi:MAG: sulfite exporter TauE/SafE family protein [Alphaproteobacteria bacterium]|nr:sulfite exporter TauE/SafE family protein [Alphaproteobacteria bacterium]
MAGGGSSRGGMAMPLELPAWDILAVVSLAFLAGGIVKGTVGIGLPLLAVPLLTLRFSVPEAVALVVIPIVASNTWQSLAAGMLAKTLRRFWPLILPMVVTIVIATRLLAAAPVAMLELALGLAVIAGIVTLIHEPNLNLPARTETWVMVGVGILGGMIGGLTSLYGLPIILFMLALRMDKDEFVGSIAFIYLCGGLALAGGMVQNQILTGHEILLSTIALLPLFAGMTLGQWLRARINQVTFRRIVLVVLVVIALNLLRRAIAGI